MKLILLRIIDQEHLTINIQPASLQCSNRILGLFFLPISTPRVDRARADNAIAYLSKADNFQDQELEQAGNKCRDQREFLTVCANKNEDVDADARKKRQSDQKYSQLF